VSEAGGARWARPMATRRVRFTSLHAAVAGWVGAAVITGCGPPPTRLTGTVTLDGRPVEAAALQFYPAAGNGQTSHAFADKTGRFVAKVSPVPLVVTISKPKPTGEKIEPFPDTAPVELMAESLAERYSDRTKSELRVTPIAGTTTVADFALSSDEKAPSPGPRPLGTP